MKLYCRFLFSILLCFPFNQACTEKSNNRDMAPGQQGEKGPKGDSGLSCTTQRSEAGSGVLVTCGDTQVELKDGTPGTSCTLKKGEAESTLTCGEVTVIVGRDAASPTCAITDGDAGSRIACGDKAIVVQHDACALMKMPDHPDLRVMQCGEERFLLKPDRSFLGYCLSGQGADLFINNTRLPKDGSADCFELEKNKENMRYLSIENANSDFNLGIINEFSGLWDLSLMCIEGQKFNFKSLANLKYLTTFVTMNDCPEKPRGMTFEFAALPQIRRLSLYGVPLQDLKLLADLFPNVSWLDLGSGHSDDIPQVGVQYVKSLEGLEKFEWLSTLMLTGDRISDFSKIASVKRLNTLLLENLPELKELSFAANIPTLENVDVWNAAVTDLSALKGKSITFHGIAVDKYAEGNIFTEKTCPGLGQPRPAGDTVEAYCALKSIPR